MGAKASLPVLQVLGLSTVKATSYAVRREPRAPALVVEVGLRMVTGCDWLWVLHSGLYGFDMILYWFYIWFYMMNCGLGPSSMIAE